MSKRTTTFSESPDDIRERSASLIHLLRARAARTPDRLAYTFLLDGETEEADMTYGELDARARAIGAWLQESGARGQRVLLLYPPGLEYNAAFWGCLYAGAVAVPAYPPRLNRNLLRLRSVVADARASVALTTAPILSRLTPLFEEAPELKPLRWATTAAIETDAATRWRMPAVTGATLAFLQYTSGSTAAPKGVMVSHGNLLHNEELIRRAFGQTEESVIVGWLPVYHDMGLIGNVLQPLYVGARCVLMSPAAFLQRPSRWLEAISRYRATTSGGPNFAYDLCVRKVGPEERAGLDLSSWTAAFNGAEPVRAETLERFAATFEPCGFRRRAFYPCYGLAEATLLVSAGSRRGAPVFKEVRKRALENNLVAEQAEGGAEVRGLVGCGGARSQVVVVNPETLTSCAGGEVGELWVGGPSVAGGYWNRPDETAHAFHAYLADTGEGPYLRTGDLGFIDDGELFITGRLKDLIIIRGRNLYAHDIERVTEESHRSLRPGCGAAFSVDAVGGERLVVVQEVDRRAREDYGEIAENVRQAVADEFEVLPSAVVLVKAGGVPKTSSGKIRRGAARELFLSNGYELLFLWQSPDVAPGDGLTPSPAGDGTPRGDEEITACLRAELAAVLGVDESQLDTGRPASNHGLDSLLAIELAHRIESRFGVVFPMEELLRGESLSELAGRIRRLSEAAEVGGDERAAPDASETHPLSHGQQALWFLHRIAPDSAAYNVAAAVRVRGRLDADALRDAFQSLVERHPALRTTFETRDDAPVQRVSEHGQLCYEQVDASHLGEEALREQLAERAHRPFDLSAGPLLRVSLLARTGGEHVLLLVAHHIVVDFWSLAILVRELGTLYEAGLRRRPANPPPLATRYVDYVRRQSRALEGARGRADWEYWRKQLGGELPTLNLPTDRPRPPVQTFRGASHAVALDAGLTRRLKALERGSGATLYMVLLAAFQILLSRHTGQDEVVVGSPSAGRSRAADAGVVGYFVNPLALRTDLSGDPSVEDLLGRVRRTVLEAFAHQDYPFPLLVQRLQPERDPSRTPLFQAMFVFQQTARLRAEGLAAFALGEEGARMEMGGLTLESLALEHRVAQFDLSLAMAEAGETLLASFEYNTDLFDEATVERLAGHFQELLRCIAEDPRRRLSELSILTAGERRQLLTEWNQTATDYALDRPLHELIEEQIRRTPDAVAVTFGGERWSYGELGGRADLLARYLRARGLGSGSRVGVLMERSFELVVSLLGVLKAGAAYVPLDPEYPAERLAFMLEDAGVGAVLTQERVAGRAACAAGEVVCVDTGWEEVAAGAESADDVADDDAACVGADDLAYVIYTSGSTGRPKGAMNTHRGIVNRLLWMQEEYGLTEDDRVLQKTPFSFDVSVWEFFWPLMVGARLVMAVPGGHQDVAYLARTIDEERITTLHFVPSMLRVFLAGTGAARFDSLRRVICSGEALSYELQERFHARCDAALHNLYGPTEAAVDVSFWACERGGEPRPVPIGRPIANTRLYILDARLRPAPVGVAGQLHIGGVGVGRGYLGRPNLTAEKFIPDPFTSEPGARLYRTGDLARFLSDGRIEYLGRLDHQVKVRGFRIELGEVEAALAAHEAVRECLVAARENEGGDMLLVAYLLAEPGAAVAAVEFRRFLAERLPEYMIPTTFVPVEAWPLLPNGKVDRRALPAPTPPRPELEASFAAPRDQIEELLAAIFASVLGIERAGIHDNFFDLGGHSLLATQVISRIQESFHVEVPLRELFKTPTVAGLAQELAGALSAGDRRPQTVEPVERSGPLPLSFAQQRLWFLDQLELGSTAYNIPVAIRLGGPLDTSALERSLGEIVNRHESLRTTFVNVGGELAQVIAPPGPWGLPTEDVTDEAEALRRAEAEARVPFDLARGPLVRARLLRRGADEHVLLLTMHHIVSDGWSIGIFIRELAALYEAFSAGQPSPLSPLTIQYADFVHWQRGRLGGAVLEEQLAYWRRQLGGELPVLDLPGDRPPASAQTHEAATEPWRLPRALGEALKRLSREHNVTLYMTLLAAFQTLLSRYTGVADVAVGTPVAGRLRVEAESLIGFFVNTLVMRGDLSGDPTFAELLERTREVTLEAHANQETPFEMLVEELQPARDFNHTPLFQVMLVLENAPLPALKLSSLSVEQIEVRNEAAKFDLILFVSEGAEGIRGTWEFDTDRFDRATIRRMAGHLETLLAGVVADPLTPLSALPLLTEAEERQLLVEWNDTRTDYPRGLCLHHLFEEQARQTPHATALIFGGERWSYGELGGRADLLARYLRARGLGSGSRVGVLMGRSFELVVSLLGVLKAGAAYVPLDPEYPAERLAFMLEDAGVGAVLTQERVAGRAACAAGEVVCVDTGWEEIAGAEGADEAAACVGADDLAYVIYTSGSTGRPKGVAIEHHSAVTLVHWALDSFTPGELEGVLASTSICFDLSVFEIFVPLSCGGKVILAADALELPELPAANQVTLVNTVPSVMAELMRAGGLPASVRTVNLAGEALQNSLVQRVYEQVNVERVLNLYGPSEDTTYSTWAVMERGSPAAPPIGRPVADTQVYVLDDRLRPVPLGVAGELYISGEGLARGYLNRPDLTAERFVPNPFSRQPGARMYRTGDLTRFLPDGQLEYLGRRDHQVKIRGFRIELGEIESVLGRHPEVRDAVVVARRSEEGDCRLVAYIVAHPGAAPTASELRRYLKDPLPDYMVPSAFVILEKLPLTPNGKVDRRALPEPEQGTPEFESAYLAPRTPVEEELAGVWSRLLRLERVSVNDNFFELGGHSLLATRVVSSVRELFEVELPLRSMFETPTIARLADRVELALRAAEVRSLPAESALADISPGESPAEVLAGGELVERVEMFRQATHNLTAPPILPVAREVALPLSFAQQRIWFHDQLSPGSAAYNILGGMRLEGRLDVDALARAINEIVRRHEALRTTFTTVDGLPMQVVAPAQPVALTLLDLRVLTEDEREAHVRETAAEELNRPFDLSKGPLLRVALPRLGDEEHVALVTMHHIAGDGWSIGIFVREVAALYEAFTRGRPSPLTELPVQYADYAVWQRQWMQGEVLEAQLDFWKRALAGPPPPLELPTDAARPEQPTLRGEKLFRRLPAELYEPLRALSRQEGATLYMTLLAAFVTQLYRYTRSEDVMVGTAIAGRNRAETDDLIGIFINMLVVRADLSGNPPFRKLLARVREAALDAYAHQDVPFEKLVEELQPERAQSRTPLFQVAFGLQNAPFESVRLPGLNLTQLNFSSDIARFDLTFWVFESEDGLTASWTYSTELFKPETVGRMHDHFEMLLRAVLDNPETKLDELDMLTAEEKRQGAQRAREREESNARRLASVKRRAVRVSPAAARAENLSEAGEAK